MLRQTHRITVLIPKGQRVLSLKPVYDFMSHVLNLKYVRCIEHTSVVWCQIQGAKEEKKNLHVVFLHLDIAFSSVPQSLVF